MGRIKVILRLLAACFACAVAIWFIRDLPRVKAARKARKDFLLRAPLKDVTYIRLGLSGGQQVSFEADATGWSMVGPRRFRAFVPAIMEMLDAFEKAPLLERIPPRDFEPGNSGGRGLTLADFGLDNPVGTIAIRGPRASFELSAGYCDTFTNGLFVMLKSDGNVYMTDPALRRFFEMSPADFADRRVFQCNMSMVHTVVLRRPALGDVKLVRDGRNWKITQPVEERADWDTVARLFDTFASATVVDDYRAGASPSAAQLERADAASVTLYRKNDLAGISLFVGNPVPGDGDLAYAQYPDGGSITVTGALRRAVFAPAYEFRDRHLFPSAQPLAVESLSLDAGGRLLSLRQDEGGWAVTAPVAAAAEPDEVSLLIKDILSLEAEQFAPFVQASAGPRIAAATIASRSRRVAFDVYAPAADSADEGRLGLLIEGTDMLFLAPAPAVSNVFARCSDPLALLSRSVISVREEEGRAVTLSRPGMPDCRIERSGGAWTAAEAGREVDADATRRLFSAAASVRAESVASLTPSNAPPSDGFAELSFDMAEGPSLRRILTVGPRAGDGHPARVKGHDTVFILSTDTVSALVRPLFVPELAAPEETPTAQPEAGKDSK